MTAAKTWLVWWQNNVPLDANYAQVLSEMLPKVSIRETLKRGPERCVLGVKGDIHFCSHVIPTIIN
jgi:hypothetical protein